MTGFCVISPIRTDLLYLASQRVKQAGEIFVVCHRFEADLSYDNGMGGSIHCQVKLAPDTSPLLAILTDFPLTFAIGLEPGRVNHQVGYCPLPWQPILDLYRVTLLLS